MTDRSDFLDCRDCRCAGARREGARLTRLYDERLRPFGLSISQFTMLTTLILAGPTTIGALAERLGVDRTTASRNVVLSAQRGLVAVGLGERDGRERFVSLTAAGQAAAEAALPAWRAAQAETIAT